MPPATVCRPQVEGQVRQSRDAVLETRTTIERIIDVKVKAGTRGVSVTTLFEDIRQACLPRRRR